MAKSTLIIEHRNGLKPGQGVLHCTDVCPERLQLQKGSFEVVEANPIEAGVLKSKHVVCPTCQRLDVAISTDRVRFLLFDLCMKKAS